MKKFVSVCHIGAGRIGFTLEFDKKRLKPASHIGMWKKNKQVKLSGICEKKKIKKTFLKKIPKETNIYKNYIKMIKTEKPDIVSIATWKDTHFEITSKCIDLGIKVIVLEKPLANTLKQAKFLIKKIKKNKVKVIVNHRRRFDKEIIKLRKLIKSGIIGEIIQVTSYYVYGILTTGTHLVDTLRMLLNDVAGEVQSVTGFKNKFGFYHPNDDENIDGVLTFKNNLKATIQSLNIKMYDNFDIYIYGTKGKILITGIGRSGLLYNIIRSPEHKGFDELDHKSKKIFGPKPRNQFGALANNAIDCLLKKNVKPKCDDKDSYIDMMIIDSLLKSSNQKNRTIKLKIKN